MNPARLETWLNRGLAYYSLADYAQAAKHYAYVLQANGADYRAHYNLGLVRAALGHQAEAIATYTQALATAPVQPEIQASIYRDRGTSQMLLANDDAALDDLNTALVHVPNDSLSR